MSHQTRMSTGDDICAKGDNELDKHQKLKKKTSKLKAETKEKKKGLKRNCRSKDDLRDDDDNAAATNKKEGLSVGDQGFEGIKNMTSESYNKQSEGHVVTEEKLKKLVHILESSEDRGEKLEALRLISEMAEDLPEVGMDWDEHSLDVDSIPLPSPLLEIPLPRDPPPSSAKKDSVRVSKSELASAKSIGSKRVTGAEEKAVTKTRLGVVTLHKNKISASGKRLQVVRHSLNELMMSVERSNKSKQGKAAKKKATRDTDGEITTTTAAADDQKETRGDGSSAVVGRRKAEIQQRINAWKEELLRDMSRDAKRRKYNLDFVDQTVPLTRTEEDLPRVVNSSNAQISPSALSRCSDAKVEVVGDAKGDKRESLLAKYSRPVLSADGSKTYDWPVEMIVHTSTEPSVSYGCNPLYFEFPPDTSSNKKVCALAKPSGTNCKEANVAGKIEAVREQGIHHSTTHDKPIGKADVPPVESENRASRSRHEEVIPGTFDDEDVDGVDSNNVATWDTSSDDGSELPSRRAKRTADPGVVGIDSSHGRRGRAEEQSPRSERSSGSYTTASDYSYRSRSSSGGRSSRSESRSVSRSDSYSSGYSKRSSRRRSYRSYSRSSRYSSSSYSSYTSSDSYYSSRSRSSRRRTTTRRRRRRTRKKRQPSRSSSARSRSRDRFGRRISRSLSNASRDRARSDSKESKRIISHKVLPVQSKKLASPTEKNGPEIPKVKVELSKSQEVSQSVPSEVVTSSSQSIPRPNKSSDVPTSASTESLAFQKSAVKDPSTPFIGPKLPSGHPLTVMQDIPLPTEELSQEEKFQPIGPNDPLVFKTKPSSSSFSVTLEKDARSQSEKSLTESFIIPPEQAERYRALRLQAERHARKVMGGLTEEDEAEEEEEVSSLMAAPVEMPSQHAGDRGNPQQQLVEELYLEQMASLIAQQQQQQLQQQHQQQQQQQQLVIQAAQTPSLGRLVHLVGGQQNVVSNPHFISLVQVGTKVMPAVPQAGAPLILAHQNAPTATLLASRTSSPAGGGTLVHAIQAEEALQARARLQQARIELAEKPLAERQEWVQIVQFPQPQPQHHGLIFTHQLHHQGLSVVHRPNVILGATRKTPALIQVPAGGQIISPAFIGAQQVMAAQPAQQMALPLLLGAHGQFLVPKFIR